MLHLKTIQAYQRQRELWGAETVALVPTMGALHEGHLSLIRMAREKADRVMVSIFVNPLQFGPNEDLAKYPRMLEQDLAHCEALGVDAVFAPQAEEMTSGDSEDLTIVNPPPYLAETFCGACRPGHFKGVATIVLKLFNVIQPTMAVFGEKDAQQLAVIQNMVKDLNVPVEILAHPTVRDANGLALSSRNSYLKTSEERQAALSLSTILRKIRVLVASSSSSQPQSAEALFRQAMAQAREDIGPAFDLFKLQYIEAVDREAFQPVTTLDSFSKVLLAGYVGDVRLIDNMNVVD